MADRRVGKKYRLVTKLGSGSFGEVYLAEDVENGENYAVKLERVKTRHPQLLYESKVYKALQGGDGIPNIKFFGKEGSYNVLVFDRLGKSIEDHFAKNKRVFEEYTTFIVGYQMIERIEFMHEQHFIHRDIKPDNFMSGYKDPEKIYVIDFGLSKRYRQPRSRKHIPYREGKSLTGTPRYASINNHLGVEQSRRDDVESIGYVLIYLAKGSLPWQGLRANTKKQKYQKIMDKKMAVKLEHLCKNTHKSFAKYLEYCRSLRYEDRPNYAFLKQCFRDALTDVYGQEGLTLKPEWCPKQKVEKKISEQDGGVVVKKKKGDKEIMKEAMDKKQAKPKVEKIVVEDDTDEYIDEDDIEKKLDIEEAEGEEEIDQREKHEDGKPRIDEKEDGNSSISEDEGDLDIRDRRKLEASIRVNVGENDDPEMGDFEDEDPMDIKQKLKAKMKKGSKDMQEEDEEEVPPNTRHKADDKAKKSSGTKVKTAEERAALKKAMEDMDEDSDGSDGASLV